MLFHDNYQCVGIFSKVWAVPPIPPWPNLMGGDKSRGIYRKSRGISPEGRGGTNPEASKNLKRKPWKPKWVSLVLELETYTKPS